MSLELWYRQDLKNILLSINVASAASARFSDEALVLAYRQGFEEALESAAVALGIPPGEVGLRLGREGQPGEHLRGLRLPR